MAQVSLRKCINRDSQLGFGKSSGVLYRGSLCDSKHLGTQFVVDVTFRCPDEGYVIAIEIRGEPKIVDLTPRLALSSARTVPEALN
jgi:hypothetical protein